MLVEVQPVPRKGSSPTSCGPQAEPWRGNWGGGGSAEDVVSSYPVTSAGPGSDVRRGGGGGGVALQQTGYQSEN